MVQGAAMRVPVSGKVVGQAERDNLARAAEQEHYTDGGEFSREFARKLCEFSGRRFCVLTNSGSSANLLVVLAEKEKWGVLSFNVGALGFPTTLAPIIQSGVGVHAIFDIDPRDLSYDGMLDIDASVLGYTPIENAEIMDLCDGMGIQSGAQIITYSFYPAHTITTGEGGAVLTDDPHLYKLLRSYRDWGRDCWCEPGQDNTCGARFAGDYDHKYVYRRMGYNLKMTEFQAAVGCAQMDRIGEFLKIRRANWEYLSAGLADLSDYFDFPKPYDPDNFHPFGFPMICRGVKRNEITRWLDSVGVGNRPIMGGNLLRQPAFKHLGNPADYPGAEIIHRHAFWIGCWHGLNTAQLDYSIEKVHEYVRANG